jgi:TPR repeat protein
LLNAANAGDALAQQAYGRSRLRPGWADYDAPLGIDWLSKSVKGGNVAAKSDLGFAYEFGIGTKPDIAKSEQLFSEAAATGQPRLLFNYAQFKVRNGASFSDELVAQLLNRAAAEGEPAAQFVLADRALTSKTSAQSIASAVQTLTSLAHEDNQSAMVRLGDYALSSTGKQDFTSAEKWYQLAAKNGNVRAQAKLGILYVNEYTDQPEKFQLGKQLLETAAGEGDYNALIELASTNSTPDLDPVSRFSSGLTGYELSGGSAKAEFDSIKLAACAPTSSQERCAPTPVFYFTNRKADKLPDGEEQYENLMASDGLMSKGVSMAYAPELTSTSPTLWYQVASAAAEHLPVIGHLFGLLREGESSSREQPNEKFELHNRPYLDDTKAFVDELHAFAINSGHTKVFVYVHGFANSFDSAVDRMALLSNQYNFPGIPIVLSWASANTPFIDTGGDGAIGYVNDSRVIRESCGSFQQVLRALVSEFGQAMLCSSPTAWVDN